MAQDIKVLIVDDSAVVRKVFSQQLSKQKGIIVSFFRPKTANWPLKHFPSVPLMLKKKGKTSC